jgi:hypothetical protein
MEILMKNDTQVTDGLVADTEGAAPSVETFKEHFLANSTLKGKDEVRDVSKAGFSLAMASAGVSDADVKRVQNAVNMATEAAADIAADDLVAKLDKMSKDDLANDETRRGVSASVRLPTHGGRTDVTVLAERSSPTPFRGEGGERQTVVKHGVIRVAVNGTARLNKDLPGNITSRIKDKLGME